MFERLTGGDAYPGELGGNLVDGRQYRLLAHAGLQGNLDFAVARGLGVGIFGIAVRNGILLVDRYRKLIEEGFPLGEAIFQGSMERLVPILMTALTAVLGLVPLSLAAGKPGSELLAPLAIVVLGGLVTSTFLNILVVPAGYALVFGLKRRQEPAPVSAEAVSPTVSDDRQSDPER